MKKKVFNFCSDLENVQKLDLNSNEVNINTNETKVKLNPMESKNTKECDKRLAQCMKCGQFAPKIGDASCPPGLECCVLVFK
jgi:coenzyme F420-reducing hydrogenase beta subunit